MRNIYVTFITLFVISTLGALAIYASLFCPAPELNAPTIQPYNKYLTYVVNDKTGNEDLLVAILGTDERKTERSRSDVIMLVKYMAKDNKVIVVSVPRDSKVSIPGRGLQKVNAAYAFGGAKLQVSILEDLFKVKNARYVHINFEGFKEIVNALGGIKINAAKDFRKDGDENIFAAKGENILTGDDLLAYVRFRHDVEGDFGRIKRQQEVLASFYASIMNSDKISKLPKTLALVSRYLDSDMNIFFIANHLKSINIDSLEFEYHTLETYSEKSNGIWYEIIDKESLNNISYLLQN